AAPRARPPGDPRLPARLPAGPGPGARGRAGRDRARPGAGGGPPGPRDPAPPGLASGPRLVQAHPPGPAAERPQLRRPRPGARRVSETRQDPTLDQYAESRRSLRGAESYATKYDRELHKRVSSYF